MNQFRAHTSVLQTRGRGRYILILLLTLWLLFAVCPAYCSTYFVATDGNDSNDGSIDHPFKTIPKAVNMPVVAGDTIYLRGGVHYYDSKISISSKSGDANNPITLQNYQNETVILDFNDQLIGSNNRGIQMNAASNYWHFKGFTIRYAGDNGLYTNGSYGIFEQLVTHGNADSGLQLMANDTGSPSYNQVINCDSYLNYDAAGHGEDADGFAAKGDDSPVYSLGLGNVFRGCRSWNNSDDGFDLWYAGNAVRIENCWAFRNGVNVWGDTSFKGDGQGIKLGQGTGAHVVIRCMSYNNQHHGFDRNSNTTGTTIYNCTGVKNLEKNFKFDDNTYVHVLRNNLSYLGTVAMGTKADNLYNSWNGFTVTDADFASLDPNFPPITNPNTYTNANSVGIDQPRGPNGELPKLRFLRLSADSLLIDAGIDVNQPFYGDAPDLGAFEHLDGDCEPDGDVDWSDLWCLASNWLDVDCDDCNGADFDGNGNVDLYDFATMADNWLE